MNKTETSSRPLSDSAYFGQLYRRLLGATLIGLVLYLGVRSGPVETPATERQSVTILLASR